MSMGANPAWFSAVIAWIALTVTADAGDIADSTRWPVAPDAPAMTIRGRDQDLGALQAAAAEAPGDPRIQVRLGDAWMQRSRESADPEQEYRLAESAYRRALKIDGRLADALVGLAWVAASRHAFDQSIGHARDALAIDPDLPAAHCLLGDASVELGDYERAEEHYQAALDLRVDLGTCSRAAHLAWLIGDANRAKWLMRKAIEAGTPHPENTAWCRAELAAMLFQSGALVLAEQEADLALEAAPGHARALAVRARIHAARNEIDKAFAMYERSIEALPNHDALAGLADLHALMGHDAEAAAWSARVIAFHRERHARQHPDRPADPSAELPHRHGNIQLARFLADANRDLDEALAEAEAAWRCSRTGVGADTLAWCHHRIGNTDAAREFSRRALELGPPDAGFLFHAGMIAAKAGDRAEARMRLYEALSLNPAFHPRDARIAADTFRELSPRPADAEGEVPPN